MKNSPEAQVAFKEKKKARRAERNKQLALQYAYLKDNAKDQPWASNIIKGRGDYFSGVRNWLRGNSSWIETAAKSLWQTVIGSGDYQSLPLKHEILNNSILGVGTPPLQAVPFMHRDGRSNRVQHRELFASVVSRTGVGVLNTYVFNVINPSMFPWLSQMSKLYQEYIVMGAVIEYVPLASDLTTAVTPGTVTLGMYYDTTTPDPASPLILANSQYGESGKVSLPHAYPVECAPNETPGMPLRIAQYGQVIYDKLNYDLGRFFVWVESCPTDGDKIGQLWITFDILFLKPIMPNTGVFTQMTHIPVDVSDVKTPMDPLFTPPEIYDTIGAQEITPTTVVYSPDSLNVGDQFLGLYVARFDGAQTTAATPTMATSNGFVVGNSVLCDSGSPDEYPSITSGACAGSGLVLTSVYFIGYDGTGTHLLPPTITFADMDGTPTSADFFLLRVPPTLGTPPEMLGATVFRTGSHSIVLRS